MRSLVVITQILLAFHALGCSTSIDPVSPKSTDVTESRFIITGTLSKTIPRSPRIVRSTDVVITKLSNPSLLSMHYKFTSVRRLHIYDDTLDKFRFDSDMIYNIFECGTIEVAKIVTACDLTAWLADSDEALVRLKYFEYASKSENYPEFELALPGRGLVSPMSSLHTLILHQCTISPRLLLSIKNAPLTKLELHDCRYSPELASQTGVIEFSGDRPCTVSVLGGVPADALPELLRAFSYPELDLSSATADPPKDWIASHRIVLNSSAFSIPYRYEVAGITLETNDARCGIHPVVLAWMLAHCRTVDHLDIPYYYDDFDILPADYKLLYNEFARLRPWLTENNVD